MCEEIEEAFEMPPTPPISTTRGRSTTPTSPHGNHITITTPPITARTTSSSVTLFPNTPVSRPWSTTAWYSLHNTYHVTSYGQRTMRYYTALAKRIHTRFSLHNAGLASGFWREWAAGFIVAQCDEGVFMFSHGFRYACLVSVDFTKALDILRIAADAEMEGCWRIGGEAYDAKKGEQWPGDDDEGAR